MGNKESKQQDTDESLISDEESKGGSVPGYSPTPSARTMVNKKMNEMIDEADSFNHINGRLESFSRNNRNEQNLKFTQRKTKKSGCCGCCR